MKIYLKVPFEQKDQVKSLGALWDYVGKSWYVESRNVDMSKFKIFMRTPPPNHLNVPHEETEYERQFRIARALECNKKKSTGSGNSHTSKNVKKNAIKAAARAKRKGNRIKRAMSLNREKSGECVIIYRRSKS